MPVPQKKSLLEVQFPIGQLSLESYLERDARTGKVLNSLGKWWGTKPIVLTRAVILGSLLQRRYCKRMEEIDGPPPESWAEINAYCGTRANSLQEWVAEMSQRRYGRMIKVGDAFSGMGSIPFAAAELGCDVYASDLNPVASLLTWGALNLIAGKPDFHAEVLAAQKKLYEEIDRWYLEQGLETSEEGWRATLYFYCVEITVPEWDGWKIPLSGTWQLLTSSKTAPWVELIPDESTKSFRFKVNHGGQGFAGAAKGTKSGADVVCPQPLWDLLHAQGKTANTSRTIKLNSLIENHGGLRRWEKSDFAPRPDDFYQERLYAIRWEKPLPKGKKINVFREPREHDLKLEAETERRIAENLSSWQKQGWIPDWRIQEGFNTTQPIRERGWTHWHHLFTPRQLLMAGEYSKRISSASKSIRPALTLNLGNFVNQSARLCRWNPAGNQSVEVFYNQAFNTFLNFHGRGWSMMFNPVNPSHQNRTGKGETSFYLNDARQLSDPCDIWITDPPYADAVNYEELSEFFLAWYKPHLQVCFPDRYTDSKREQAVRGDDAAFRVSMSECYSNLTKNMPENGLQVLMFTHKDTEVWEDLALIMWSAGLQVKQVWSIATETPGAGIRVGNYVQATYNMVLRKRPSDAPMGFVDLVIPQIKVRVEEVIRHMRDSQVQSGGLNCGYTDTDYLLAAQAVAAEVVTGFSSIDGIDLDEELRTPNKQRGNSVLKDLMNQAKRTAVDFLVPPGLEEHLRRSPDGASAYQFWRSLAPEEKFLLKSLELEAGGVSKIGAFQDLGRAYGIADYEDLLGPVVANAARSKLPDEFPRADLTRWDEVPANERGHFSHSVTRHLYHALKMLAEGADADRAVKHLVGCTNFWSDRQSRLLVILAYLYQTTGTNTAWDNLRPQLQTLRLAVENHRA
jgi:putative DNA methylase